MQITETVTPTALWSVGLGISWQRVLLLDLSLCSTIMSVTVRFVVINILRRDLCIFFYLAKTELVFGHFVSWEDLDGVRQA